ncbi:GDP-6-deoxy-D-mannose reductase [compost metagenome]
MDVFRVSSRYERRDFLDVRDAVRAYAYLLADGASGHVYPVCSGIERSLEEVTNTMLTISGSRIPILWEDSRTVEPLKQARRADDLESLGWKPEISFASSLQEVIQYTKATKGEI